MEDETRAEELLSELRPQHVVADAAYGSDAIRKVIRQAKPIGNRTWLPVLSQRPTSYDKERIVAKWVPFGVLSRFAEFPRARQYTSDDFRKTSKTLGNECSVSRTGNCYENAVAERFFWSLKHEWTNHEQFADLESTRLSAFKYIETIYNCQRLHQTLGYETRNQYEAEQAPALAAQ